MCHKWDDMPSFFSLFQPLHSANAATSFCKQIRLILLTNSNLRANEVISSSQRNRIFKPAQSNHQASAVGCIGSMKRMNLRNEEHGFISVSGSAYHGLLKLRHDVAFAASRRNNQCVATQQQIRRDVIPATSCPIK